jgi:hypothetical protein
LLCFSIWSKERSPLLSIGGNQHPQEANLSPLGCPQEIVTVDPTLTAWMRP